jgi:DNA-binding beta-propeller fold protein YncE
MRMKRITSAIALTLLLASCQPVIAQTVWEVVNTFQIGGQGGWDYLTVDPQTRLLYVPRTTHTLVIDSQSGKTIADIPGQKNARGVAIAPAAGRGFISDGGGDGAIVVFDLKRYAYLARSPRCPMPTGSSSTRSAGTSSWSRDGERR